MPLPGQQPRLGPWPGTYTNNARQTSVTPTSTSTIRARFDMIQAEHGVHDICDGRTGCDAGRIFVRRDVKFVETSTVWLLKAVNALSATCRD